jgi:hypothetical protein
MLDTVLQKTRSAMTLSGDGRQGRSIRAAATVLRRCALCGLRGDLIRTDDGLIACFGGRSMRRGYLECL